MFQVVLIPLEKCDANNPQFEKIMLANIAVDDKIQVYVSDLFQRAVQPTISNSLKLALT